MYKLKADGVVFYDPSADDMTLQVLSPRASFELNKPGTLEFTMLPGNVAYNSLHKMKTVITLEFGDEIVFCGRVLETTTDQYNQVEVYCEGEMGYLYDTIQRPYKFDGKPADLFAKILTAHNEQAEDFKRFEPGIVTNIDENEEMSVNGETFSETFAEIQSLLIDEYGGYLRVRRENGVRYLDLVSSFDQPCSQSIDFGVNMVDIENKINMQDVCTVLIPVGKMINGEYTNIKVANNGLDYLEDAEGIERYGRIVKTYTWEDVIDPVELKSLAVKHMATLKGETTLTVTAVDLSVCGVAVDRIHLGDTVHLRSIPHGLDKDEVCTQIELNIEKPEKSEYTFGFPPETFTDSNANTVSNFNSLLLHQHKWLTETDTALNINVEAVNLIGHRTTQLEIDVDAAEEAITLKASQDDVNILEEKHTAVELRLDAAEDSITAKADKVKVEAIETEIKGLLKADELAAEIASLSYLHVGGDVNVPGSVTADSLWVNGTATLDGGIVTDTVDAVGVDTTTLTINGSETSWKGTTVVTGIGTVSQSKRFLNIMLADGSTAQLDIVTDVSITPSTSYINYLGKS